MDTIFLYAVIAVIVAVFVALNSAGDKKDSDVCIVPTMPKFGSKPERIKLTQKSKLQAIKPISEKETVTTAQSQVKEPVTVESKPMKPNLRNTSLLELVKDPAFRWAVLCVLLAVLIFCLWPRDEYVSMGHGLILNKRTGEVHRAYDRLNK